MPYWPVRKVHEVNDRVTDYWSGESKWSRCLIDWYATQSSEVNLSSNYNTGSMGDKHVTVNNLGATSMYPRQQHVTSLVQMQTRNPSQHMIHAHEVKYQRVGGLWYQHSNHPKIEWGYLLIDPLPGNWIKVKYNYNIILKLAILSNKFFNILMPSFSRG